MRHVTILIICLFLVSVSVLAFADDPAPVIQPAQEIDAEAVEEGKMMDVARELPSTLITGEEKKYDVMKKVEELREGYVYDEDPHE